MLDISLAGESAASVENVNSHITLIGQALLGFVLPWILALIAIPLEMFIEASQHAFARVYTILITLLCHLSTVIAYLIEGLFKIFMHLFDIYIIIPVQIASLFNGKLGGGKMGGKSVSAT